MRLVKPSFELLAIYGRNGLPYSYSDPERLIEIAGRTCYKSEDKITPESSRAFVRMLKKRGHRAMIEHSWEVRKYDSCIDLPKYPSPFLYRADYDQSIVAGNLRAFYESDLPPDQYQVIEDEKHILEMAIHFDEPALVAMTAKFIIDRGVANEFVRHRPPGYGQESTRFCDYSSDKFEGHVTFVIPPWFPNIKQGIYKSEDVLPEDLTHVEYYWMHFRLADEEDYKFMIRAGLRPEQARGEHPISLKTELVVTASMAEWQHINALRDLGISGNPHPQMLEVMKPFFSVAGQYVPFFKQSFMWSIIEQLKEEMP